MKLRHRLLIGQAVVFVMAVSLPWLVLGPVPGILRWTAPVLCPAGQPDAIVVEYSTRTSDGTGTSSTLVCMGPRGDITEVGSWAPLGVALLGFWLVFELLVVGPQLLGALRRRRRRARGLPDPTGPTAALTLSLGRSRRPGPPPPDPSTKVG